VEIHEHALTSNLHTLRILAPDARFAPVVKSNAYGHGLREIVPMLARNRVDAFAVDSLEEALEVFHLAPDALILIMGYVPPDRMEEVVSRGFHLSLFETSVLVELERVAARLGKPACIHLKIDTGMSRLGFLPADFPDLLSQLRGFPHIKPVGLSTHFADMDQPGRPEFSTLQFRRFEEILTLANIQEWDPLWIHCANSAATILYPDTHKTMVRPGLALYGIWPSEAVEDAVRKHNIASELNAVLSWKTRIVQIKTVPPGTPIGYGLTETVTRRSRLGVIPVGYADGYDRAFSRKAHVLVNGIRCKVLGTVCMNMTVIDLSTVPHMNVGNEVTLLGRGGPHVIGARELARWRNTIEYEIFTSIHPHIPRVIC
jgi:alanine racemase